MDQPVRRNTPCAFFIGYATQPVCNECGHTWVAHYGAVPQWVLEKRNKSKSRRTGA